MSFDHYSSNNSACICLRTWIFSSMKKRIHGLNLFQNKYACKFSQIYAYNTITSFKFNQTADVTDNSNSSNMIILSIYHIQFISKQIVLIFGQIFTSFRFNRVAFCDLSKWCLVDEISCFLSIPCPSRLDGGWGEGKWGQIS